MSEDLTPQQTDAVRRALRAARHEAPLPDDVAARLDTTLAGLVADRAAAEPAAAAVAAVAASSPADGADRVVPLRRRWPAYLAAAAAVTAIGLTGTQLVDRGGSDSGAASSADSAPPESSALAESREDDAADAFDGDVLSQLDGPTAPTLLTDAQRADLAEAGYRRIELAPDLRTALTNSERSAAKSLSSPTPATGATSDLKALARRCSLPDLDLPTGVVPTYYLARHEGEQAVLVVLPGPEVTAYPCGSGAPERLPLD